MQKRLWRLSPARIIALGFASVILIGSGLLMLPCSVRSGVRLSYIDALYTAASAVCVTGLCIVDTGTALTGFGQFVMALLMQIGGLGVATVGASVILLMGKRVSLKGRSLIREAGNLSSVHGAIRFVKTMLVTSAVFELAGAALSFPVFVRDFPPLRALGISLFHAIAAFNNAGFDNLGLSGEVGSNVSLIPYQDNILLNLVTCVLVIFGGIGFLVIQEIRVKKFHWKKYSFHARVVLTTTALLLLGGTVLVKLSENMSWMTAFFHSVSARTAGFSTYSLGSFSNAGLLTMMVLMFIGASPGSTGGGVKTTTLFVLFKGIESAATNKREQAFRYSLPKDAFRKAAVIAMLAFFMIILSTYLLILMDPQIPFIDALFEMVSAFATVGLSTGITPTLSFGSKVLSICIMFIGRLGPLTVASLWYFTNGDRVNYPEGDIAIG